MAVLSLGIDARRYVRNFNWPLAIAPLLIAILGVVCIQSADLHDPDAAGEYKKQFLYILLGVPLMFGFSLVDYRNWRRWAPGAVHRQSSACCCFILRGGHSALGAQRWISLGPLGTFQPSEPAKLVLAISIAFVLCRHTYDRIQDLWKPLLTAAIPALLILKQPDLGTSLVIGAILTVQLFFGLPKLGDFLIYVMAVLTAARPPSAPTRFSSRSKKRGSSSSSIRTPIRRARATISISRRSRSATASGSDAACITARRRS